MESTVAVGNINKLTKGDTQRGYNLPPLSFPKQLITFSNSKQDVCCKFIRRMDAPYELVRLESDLLIGIESDSVPVSLLTFSAGREKVKSPTRAKSKPEISTSHDERRRAKTKTKPKD